MKKYFPIIITIIIFVCLNLPEASSVNTTPGAELKICSQNLNRFMDSSRKRASEKDRFIMESFLERVSKQSCDVLALQEVSGRSTKEASRVLKALREYLQKETAREYRYYVSKSNDSYIRNAYLVAKGVGKVVETKSFSDYSLRPLSKYGRERYFSRGPFMLHLRVPTKGIDEEKDLLIFNLHFKSKRDSWKDPGKVKFEDLRMEMAEGLREIAMREKIGFSNEPIVVILGDRNSSINSASANILYGKYRLDDFRELCALNEDSSAKCKKNFDGHKKVLTSIFYPRGGELEEGKSSYKYRKKFFLYDDIVVSSEDLGFFKGGFEGGYREELDHKMVWAEIDW